MRDVVDDVQLDFARRPITYFNDKCGRCHGNYGSYWLEGVLAGLAEEKLRREVDEMAAGPAQAPLEGVALDAQVAYHRSLIDGKPFVTLFRTDGGGLAGEVTPGSRVVLITRDGEREARVEEHRWQSEIREASAIRVTRGGQVTDMLLELPDESASAVIHSHPR